MQLGVAANDAHERFNINRDLAEAEDHQAEVTAGERFQREAGARVERGERHGGFSS